MENLSNFININPDEFNTPIYRIFPWKRFISSSKKNEIVLVKPKLWDDPFENFILNLKGKLKDGSLFSFEKRDDIYGQCWSLHNETDAMWRIYSQDKNGVKVKTTINKLYQFINQNNNYNFQDSLWIGKVQYNSRKKFMEYVVKKLVSSNLLSKSSIKDIVSTLLIKRWEFRHEKEIRILFIDLDRQNSKDIYSFKLPQEELFEEIVLDPRLDDEEYHKRKIQLDNMFHCQIKKSKLYTLPKSITIKF